MWNLVGWRKSSTRNKSGVVGFITNHGFLDNPTFRGMRWRILKEFDEVYILDLHGNSNRKEQTPRGADEQERV